MKKTLFILAAIALTTILHAQINELVGLNPNQVIGVFKDQNKAFTLSFLETRNSDRMSVYQVSYLDKDYKRLEIQVPDSFIYQGSAEAENANYVMFWNQKRKLLKLFSVNNLKLISNDISLDSAPNLSPFFYQYYVMADQKLAITFNYSKDLGDKNIEYGYDVILINPSDLKKTGEFREIIATKKINEPTQIRVNVIDVLSTNSGYVLMRELSSSKNKKYDIELLFLDKGLEVLNSTLLTEEEKNKFIPSQLDFINNKVVVLGNYMFSSIFKSWNSEGLFIKTFDSNGENGTSIEYPWKDLKTKLKESKKGRGDFVFDGKNRIVIEDIVATDNGFQVICESYTMSTGFTPSEFLLPEASGEKVITIYDFVLFTFSTSNELTEIDIFEKEKMNIDITGYGGKNYSNFLIAEQLRSARILPYQYFADNELHFITYKNGDGYFSKLNINDGNIENLRNTTLNPQIETETNAASNEFIANSGFLSSLNKLAEGMDKLDANLQKVGNKLDYAMNKVDLKFNGLRTNPAGYVLLNNNKKVLFLMDMNRMSVFYELSE